ncbi:MAG: divalent-cation tolerance protein CutA [Candidatus Tectimicrobiota bacterium]
MTPYRIVFMTAGAEEEAVRIAHALVERRLAACVNIVSPVRSIYRWEGKVCDEQEHLLVAKTHVAQVAGLMACVEELHSYEVPEALAMPIETGLRPYLQWVEESCSQPGTPEG